MSDYTEHYLFTSLDETRQHQKQWRAGVAFTVGRKAVESHADRNPTGYRLSREDRFTIAQSELSLVAASGHFNVPVSLVKRCRREYEETAGQMIEGTFDLGIPGLSRHSVEFRYEVASREGTIAEVARHYGLPTSKVANWREELAAGNLDV